MLMLLLGCAAEKAPQENGTLRVLTYNVKGLPDAITGDDTSARMELIAPLLRAHDVIGLQEDFQAENHDLLISEWPAEVSWFDQMVDDRRVYGPGLSSLSAFAVTADHSVHYHSCNGLIDGSADCLASKGLQVLRLDGPAGQPLWWLNTHLEAGSGAEDLIARAEQVEQLLELIPPLIDEDAMIVAGDFNLHTRDAEDVLLLDAITDGLRLIDSCAAVNCPESGHIDRIFYRGSSSLALEASHWERAEEMVDSQNTPLSDHPAIRVQLDWVSDVDGF